MKKMTYAESGVDIEKEERAIKVLLSSITSKRKGIDKPLGGHYAGMIEFGDGLKWYKYQEEKTKQ